MCFKCPFGTFSVAAGSTVCPYIADNHSSTASNSSGTCPPPPQQTCCSKILHDTENWLRFDFEEKGPLRSISSVSVRNVDDRGRIKASETSINIGDSQSVTGCMVLPLTIDAAKGPGWASGPLLCDDPGTWVALSFPGSVGPLSVKLCTLPRDAAGAFPVATLSVYSPGEH